MSLLKKTSNNNNKTVYLFGLKIYSKIIKDDYTERKYFLNLLITKDYPNKCCIELFWFIKFSYDKLKISKKKTRYWLDYILDKIDEEHDDIYITFNASGESYFFMQSFKEICEIENSKNPVIITVRAYHNIIADMFIPQVKKYYIPECWKLVYSDKFIINYKNHRFFIVLPLFHYQNWENQIEKDINLHYYTSFLSVFNLNYKQIAPKQAIIPQCVRKNMLEKVKKIGLNINKFIFISTKAVSNPSLSNNFWKLLDRRIHQLGYDIFYNEFDEHIEITNMKSVYLDKMEVQALVELSKGVIALKSGLIEPLCIIHNIPIISIYTSMYPRLNANLKAMSAESHMRACSNTKLPNTCISNIYEFNGEKYNEIDLVDKITNIIMPKLDYIETHIVDHCNLNCKACSHYCNVTKPNFINIDHFNRDMAELSKKFDIKQIRLMGGEPLLAPNINEFLMSTRKYFPNADIRLVSNGILLSKKTEDFWETLKNTKIKIDLTKYPIGGTSFSEGMDTIGKHVFNYYRHKELGFYVQETAMGDFWMASHFQLTMNSTGSSDISKAFNKCPYKRCINLINGKITHCPTAGYIHNYNTYFNENIPEENGIDIYNHTAKEIMDYLQKPIETCKYCTFDENVKLTNWEISKKDKDEWFVDKIEKNDV